MLTTSRVVFHWKPAGKARGFDLRLARNRGFTVAVQTIHVRRSSGRATLVKGAWYWKVRSRGSIASRWSNTRMLRVRPSKDLFAPTRPGALRVTSIASSTAPPLAPRTCSVCTPVLKLRLRASLRS
jgi:hypothetical protein